MSAGFQLDLRGSKFAELIGFEKKPVDKEEIGSKLPNITNSIDAINLNSDVITDSLVDGISSNTLAVIPTEDLRSSFPFIYHPPINWLFNPVSSNYLQSMNFYLRDVLNRPINLNGMDWYLELVLRSTPKYQKFISYHRIWEDIPYILVYKSNACISRTLFLKPKIQLF